MKFNLLSIAVLLLLSCSEELDISEFSGDFAGYEPELRIEAIILPTENTTIVRIDRLILIDEAELYNCIDDDGDWNYYYCPANSISYESNSECLEACGEESNCILHLYSCKVEEDDCEDCNWPFDTLKTYPTKTECLSDCQGKCLTDDVGEDGIQAYDSNDDGDYDDIGIGGDIAPDEGEGDGIPGCNEKNVDEYDEILPQIHVQGCVVEIVLNETETCNFIYDSLAADFFYTEGKHPHPPNMEDIEIVQYGAYIPDSACIIAAFNWRDYEGEYSFSAFCPSFSELETIRSKEPIRLSRPVVFFMEDERENMKSCVSYECLDSTSTISDIVYFAEKAPEQYLYYASLFESSYYQAVQYHLDKTSGEYKITHEHPDQATDIENIWGNICLMKEKIITQIFDGNDDGIDEADISKYEIFTFSQSFTNYYFFDMLDISDPVRTNLRDQNGEGVMGTFGSMTSNEINLQIIDCWQFENEIGCADSSNSDCQWILAPAPDNPDSVRWACDIKIPE